MGYCSALARTMLAGLSLIAVDAGATSFDCAKASTYSEVQICSSQSLQALDEQLNSAYVQALGKAADKTALRAEQRDWIKHRDQCATPECISQAIESRSRALSDVRVPLPAPQPKVAPSNVHPTPKTPPKVAAPLLDVGTGEAQRPSPPRAQVDPPKGSGSAGEAIDTRTLKIGSFVMAVLLLICIWLHSRGSMVIYSCYTDALWTSLTPFLSIGSYFVAKTWLELSTNVSLITAAVVAGLMSLQIIIQTFRSNGFSLFFLLALYAKIILFSIYFLSMAALIFGGGRTASDRRRRRNWALAGSVLFVALTGWMCRTRQFSHIDDYIAGRT